MAIDYNRLDQTARRLIRENGVEAELRRDTEGAYDPLTDTDPSPTSDTYTVQLVMTPVRSRDHDFDIETIKKVAYEIQKITKMLISSEGLPAGFFPKPGDVVTLINSSGEVWRVGGNNPIRPNDVPLVHKVYAFQ